MSLFARVLRALAKARFRLLGLATIKDIPTDHFNRILRELIDGRWIKTYEYAGFDAWIDWGCIKLRKRGRKLKLEWDNWSEGSIEGPPDILEQIAAKHGFEVRRQWRWSDYDDN